MNSYEFMQNINRDIGGLVTIFDSTMALYQIMNAFDGFKVMNLDNVDTAVIQYTVCADDPNKISEFVAVSNNLMVTVYDHIYAASAALLADGKTVLISLRDTRIPTQE